MASGAVILDFDGTLVDSVALGIDCANEVLAEMGRPVLDAVQVAQLRGQTFRAGLATLGIPLWRLPGMALGVRRRMRARSNEIRPIPGMREAMERLVGGGHPVAVLTNNDATLVADVLERYGFPVLAAIRTGNPVRGKASALRTLLREQGWSPTAAVYVSDEHRDVEASQAAGLPMIAVTWGVNARGLLESAHPAACLDRPEELPAVVDAVLAARAS